MNNRKRNIRLQAVCIFALLLGSVVNVSADFYEGFVVKAELPDNQYNNNVNYFDLMLKPKETQTIKVEVKNTGNEVMVATAQIEDAVTGYNGSKLYLSNEPRDKSLKTPLSNIAKLKQNKIKVMPGTSTLMSVDINMPNEEFKGIILGGIRVVADTETTTEKKTDEDISLNNRIEYLIAIQLRNNEDSVEENLNLIEVGASLTEYDPSVFVKIQNDQSILMNDITIVGEVTDMSGKTVYGNINRSNRGIMPNTNFDIIYDMKDSKLSSGEYLVNLKITHNDRVWEWKETLTIEDNEAKEINEGAIFSEPRTDWFKIIVSGVLILILVILLLVIWKRRKKNNRK